jgi:ethanolamine utilization protein EutN
MHPAKVIGRVVCSRQYETLRHEKLLVVQPTDWPGAAKGEPFIAIDAVGAGADEWIMYVQSREAAFPFKKMPPVDAAIVAIIDGVEFRKELL